jgi:hypothetical protein
MVCNAVLGQVLYCLPYHQSHKALFITDDHRFKVVAVVDTSVINKQQQIGILYYRSKAVPLHAMEALGGRGVAPTHSRPRH